jgi:hypothetical protein
MTFPVTEPLVPIVQADEDCLERTIQADMSEEEARSRVENAPLNRILARYLNTTIHRETNATD